MMIVWQLTEKEVEELVAVLDVATKAAGMQVAKTTVALMDSLMNAVANAKEE